MIDAGVVVAYLGAAVARGGTRLLDTAVDAGLDRLSGAVARRLGRQPESDLARDPRSPAVQAHVAREIEAAALRDPAFARALTALVAQLDRSGGRRLINSVRAQVNVQAFDGGYAHHGDYYEGDLLGTAMIAAVLLAMPYARPEVSWIAGVVGGLFGLTVGLGLNRARSL